MTTPVVRWERGALLVTVHAQPGASRDEIVGLDERGLKVRVQAPPVKGAANRRLIQLLAEAFGVAIRNVSVRAGGGGRGKLIRIEGPQQIPTQLKGHVRLNKS